MGKRQEETEDDVEADVAPPGGWPRLMAGAQARIVGLLDRTIVLLQRQRLRFVPAGEAEAEKEAEKNRKLAAAEAAALPPPKARPLLMFLIGLTMLILGTIAGAVFSFDLFAQKIETQGDMIADQADEVFAANKDAKHAERVLETVKADNKDMQQQLEQAQAALQQAKVRLAEVEGSAVLYGGRQRSTGPAASSEGDPYSSRPATSSGGKRMANATCQLGSGSASADLSKCLEQADR